MFIGHFGVGLAAKKIDKKPSLGTLFMAAQWMDLVWPLLLLFGLEKVNIEPNNNPFLRLDFIYYPFTHSLFSSIIWAVLFGLVYFIIRKNLKSSILLGVLVLSHWILDFIVHEPDLMLVPWSNVVVGLGLWNSVVLTIIVEGSIFILGSYLYIISTRAKNKTGQLSLWGLMIFLAIIYIVNIFGSPPPSVSAIGYAGLSQWIIVIWAYWIDNNRINVGRIF
jgi:membrane-bound metal-dependent hydrolase YbcI (DUF457 family)